jgi:SPP1 gp7 family putative phage head morphogenesis protein
MKFDEFNVLEQSKRLYQELNDLNEEVYLEIANTYYKEINPKGKLSKKWLLGILLGYDAVTKYVYEHEVDRKRSRFAEALISSSTKSKEFITAMNLWSRQTDQYGINITDAAVVQAYDDVGIKKLKWNTERDGRVCPECKKRDGKIYNIKSLPPKPHWGCRCYYTPVKEERDA